MFIYFCKDISKKISLSNKNVNADYGGMVQPSEQHVAPCVTDAEWGMVTRGLRMVAALWSGIPVEVTQEDGVVLRCIRAAIWIPFYSPHATRRETVRPFYSPPTQG